MKVKLIIAAIILGGLVLAVVLVAVFALNPIVRNAVVRIASGSLQVPTSLGGADVSFSGRVALEKFEAANPNGYTEPFSFKFGRFDAALASVWAAFGDEIVLQQVEIDSPELTIEFIGTKTNLSVLMDNLGKTDKAPPESGPSKKFRIAKFRMTNAAVQFKSDVLAGGAKKVVLPPIELTDIGGKSGWVTASEVLSILLKSLAKEAVEQGKSFLPESLQSGVGSVVGTVKKEAQELPGKIKDAAEKNIFDPLRKK